MTTAPPGRARRADDLPQFRATGEEVVHQGWVITLTRAGFEDPDGVAFERDVVRHPGAVAVVAVTDDDCLVLVHQYRPAIDGWILEAPAGTCDVEGEPHDDGPAGAGRGGGLRRRPAGPAGPVPR